MFSGGVATAAMSRQRKSRKFRLALFIATSNPSAKSGPSRELRAVLTLYRRHYPPCPLQDETTESAGARYGYRARSAER